MIRAMCYPRKEVSRDGDDGDDSGSFSPMVEPKSRKTCHITPPAPGRESLPIVTKLPVLNPERGAWDNLRGIKEKNEARRQA
jgi:hypothetical protein